MAVTFRDYSADQVKAARSVLLELVRLGLVPGGTPEGDQSISRGVSVIPRSSSALTLLSIDTLKRKQGAVGGWDYLDDSLLDLGKR
jgi:hypothetical protein